MPKNEATPEEIKERKVRAKEWKSFRVKFKITQRKLEDILDVSRRTIQMVEKAKVKPHAATIRRFEIVKNRYEAGFID